MAVTKKIGELRVAELRVELEKRSLDSKGLKGTLVQRLQEAIENEGGNPNEIEISEEIPTKRRSNARKSVGQKVVAPQTKDETSDTNNTESESGVQSTEENENAELKKWYNAVQENSRGEKAATEQKKESEADSAITNAKNKEDNKINEDVENKTEENKDSENATIFFEDVNEISESKEEEFTVLDTDNQEADEDSSVSNDPVVESKPESTDDAIISQEQEGNGAQDQEETTSEAVLDEAKDDLQDKQDDMLQQEQDSEKQKQEDLLENNKDVLQSQDVDLKESESQKTNDDSEANASMDVQEATSEAMEAIDSPIPDQEEIKVDEQADQDLLKEGKDDSDRLKEEEDMEVADAVEDSTDMQMDQEGSNVGEEKMENEDQPEVIEEVEELDVQNEKQDSEVNEAKESELKDEQEDNAENPETQVHVSVANVDETNDSTEKTMEDHKVDSEKKDGRKQDIEVDVLDMLDYDIDMPGHADEDDNEVIEKPVVESKEEKTLKKEDNISSSKIPPSTSATKSTSDASKTGGLHRNLWISGLSSSTRASELKTAFSRYGKVTSAKVVTNAKSPGSRCYGYVSMCNEEAASKCILHLNETEMHGRLITVEIAKSDPSAPKKPASSNTKSVPSTKAADKPSNEASNKASETGEKTALEAKSDEAEKKSIGSSQTSKEESDKGRVSTRPPARGKNDRNSTGGASSGTKRTESKSPTRRLSNRDENDLRNNMQPRKRAKQQQLDLDRKVVIDTKAGELRVNVNSESRRGNDNRGNRRRSPSPPRNNNQGNNRNTIRLGRGDARNKIGRASAGGRPPVGGRFSTGQNNNKRGYAGKQTGPVLSLNEIRARREGDGLRNSRQDQRPPRRDQSNSQNSLEREREKIRKEREERERMLRLERDRLERERKALERDRLERERLEQERLRVEMERKRELEGIEREKAEMRRLTELNRIEIEQRQRAIKRSYGTDDYSSDRHRLSGGRSTNRDAPYEAKRAMLAPPDRDQRNDSKRDRDDRSRGGDYQGSNFYSRNNTSSQRSVSPTYRSSGQSDSSYRVGGKSDYQDASSASSGSRNARRGVNGSHQEAGSSSRYNANSSDLVSRHSDKYGSANRTNRTGAQTSPDARRIEPRRKPAIVRDDRKAVARERDDDSIYRSKERGSSSRIEIQRVPHSPPIRREVSPPTRRRDRSPMNDQRWRDSGKASAARRETSTSRRGTNDRGGDLREEIRGSRQSSSYSSSDREEQRRPRRRSDSPDRPAKFNTSWPATAETTPAAQLYAGHTAPTQARSAASPWQNPLAWPVATSAAARSGWMGAAALQASAVGRAATQLSYVAPPIAIPPPATTILPNAQQAYAMPADRSSRSIDDRFSQYKSLARRY